MIQRSTRLAVAIAAIGLALVTCSAAHAGTRRFTLRTPALTPDSDGYLYCTVVAMSDKPIGIVATILSARRDNVTEFGSSWRVSPSATADGSFHAEETLGSFDDGARYCRAVITGARKADVHLSLTAFDANGNPIATAEAP